MFLISLRYSERFPGLVGTFSYPRDCEGYKNEAGIISDSSGPVLGSKKQMERKTKVSLNSGPRLKAKGEVGDRMRWLDSIPHGCEIEQTLGDGRRQRNLVCCNPCSHKEQDTT